MAITASQLNVKFGAEGVDTVQRAMATVSGRLNSLNRLTGQTVAQAGRQVAALNRQLAAIPNTLGRSLGGAAGQFASRMAGLTRSLVQQVGSMGAAVARKVADVTSRIGAQMKADLAAGGRALAAGAAALGVVVGGSLGTVADFEKQISAIGAVGGEEAARNLDRIRELAIGLGADTSYSASEAAAGIETIIKAGLDIETVMQGAAKSVLDLAAASGTSVEDSSRIMSNVLNIFGDHMDGFADQGARAAHIADLLAQAANASATDVGELGYAVSSAGAIMDNLGYSVDETARALGLLANAGIRGSDAGTGLRSMMGNLLRETKPVLETFRDLGLEQDWFKNAEGGMRSIEEIMGILRQRFDELGYDQVATQQALNKIFGFYGAKVAATFIGLQEGAWDDFAGAMDNAGTVGEAAGKRLDNLAGDVEKLRGSLESLRLKLLGTAVRGPLRVFVQRIDQLVDYFVGLPESTLQVVGAIVGLSVAVAGGVGIWSAFGAQILSTLRGLALLSPAVLLIGGALAGLYTAYRANFLGFADGVDGWLGKLRDGFARLGPTVEDFGRLFRRNMELTGGDPVASALDAGLRALRKNFGADNPVVRFAERAKSAIFEFGRAAVAGFQALRRGAAAAWGFIEGKVLPTLGALWGYFSDIAGGAGYLGDKLDTLPAGLQPVARLLGAILQFVVNVPKAYQRGGFEGMVASILNHGGRILGELGNLLGGVGSWLVDRIKEIDWPTVATTVLAYGKAAILKLWDGVVGGWNTVVKPALLTVGGWLLDAWNTIDWGPVWTAVGTAGKAIAVGLRDGAAWAWENVLRPWLADRGADLLAWWNGIDWTAFWTNVRTVGGSIAVGFRDGAVAAWETVLRPWLADRGADLLAAWRGIDWAAVWAEARTSGAALLVSLRDGALRAWDTTVKPWLSQRGAELARWWNGIDWTQAWTNAKTSGAAILVSVRDGAQDAWDTALKPWLEGLGGLIGGAIDGLGQTTFEYSDWRLYVTPPGSEDFVTIDWTGVKAALADAWSVDAGQLGFARDLGENVGTKIGELLAQGVNAGIDALFARPLDPAGARASGEGAFRDVARGIAGGTGANLGDAFAEFDRSFSAALWAALEPALQRAKTILFDEHVGPWLNGLFDVDLGVVSIDLGNLFNDRQNDVFAFTPPDLSIFGTIKDWFGEQLANATSILVPGQMSGSGHVLPATRKSIFQVWAEGVMDSLQRASDWLGEQFGRIDFGDAAGRLAGKLKDDLLAALTPDWLQGIADGIAEKVAGLGSVVGVGVMEQNPPGGVGPALREKHQDLAPIQNSGAGGARFQGAGTLPPPTGNVQDWTAAGRTLGGWLVSEIHAAILALPVTAGPYVSQMGPRLAPLFGPPGEAAGAVLVRAVANEFGLLAGVLAPYVDPVQATLTQRLGVAGAAGGGALVGGLRGGFQGQLPTLFGVIQQAANRIEAPLRALAARMPGVGESIAQGLAEGIARGMEATRETVASESRSLEGASRNALKASSPAKVFIPVGETIPQGIGVGVQRGWPEIERLLAQNAARLADGVAETLMYTKRTGNAWRDFDRGAGQTKDQWLDYHRMLGTDLAWARNEIKRSRQGREWVAPPGGTVRAEDGSRVPRSFYARTDTVPLRAGGGLPGINADFGLDDVAARRIATMHRRGFDYARMRGRLQHMGIATTGSTPEWLQEVLNRSAYGGYDGTRYEVARDRLASSLRTSEAGYRGGGNRAGDEAAAKRHSDAAASVERAAKKIDEAATRMGSLSVQSDVTLDDGAIVGRVVTRTAAGLGRANENGRQRRGGV